MYNLKQVLDFWFSDEVKLKWWVKDKNFDYEIRDKFLSLHSEIIKEGADNFLNSAEDALAAIIVLDQFSRNMFRGDKKSFAFDIMALDLAKKSISKGFDKVLDDEMVAFMYMPFMHSEDLKEHETAIKLFSSRKGLQQNYNFELAHKKIIDRFGHYPHRNEILGRANTAEETAFLKTPNSSF